MDQSIADFTEEVRSFLSEHLTAELRRAGEVEAGVFADRPIGEAWIKILAEKGWSVPDWPVEWGGTNWTPEQHLIWQRELTLANAPQFLPAGVKMVGPAIMQYGTEEQKQYYLPRIRSGEDWWAQGYSEPGAGSDLAALQCQAVRDGDEYVINGTKIWTTHAQFCNRMFCLVRTDNSGVRQQGITFLLFDLDIPGIEIKPLISISGDHEFNQVFFTDARVPVSGRLGDENDGWSVAKYLLTHERGGKTATGMLMRLDHLKGFVKSEAATTGQNLFSDQGFAAEFARTTLGVETFTAFEDRVFSNINAAQSVGAISSVLKIRQTELRQQIDELVLNAVHYYGLPYQPEVREFRGNATAIGSTTAATAMPRYLNNRAATIYAGSNEIQRNIIAKQILELP